MKGYSNHSRAIAQIAAEMNIDQKQVQFICDRILAMKSLTRSAKCGLVLPGLGSLRLAKSKFVKRRRELADKITERELNNRRHQKRKKMKAAPPREVPSEPFYFDLNYL